MKPDRLTVGQLKALLAEQPDDVVVAVQCCNGSDIAHVLQAGTFESSYSSMCGGSEMLGDRTLSGSVLGPGIIRCRQCKVEMAAFSSTYDLVPVHNAVRHETFNIDPMVYKTMYDGDLMVFHAESDYVGYADRDLDSDG